jgi:2,3-bisphosphoglycerate-independent phosphoglycerate mutase
MGDVKPIVLLILDGWGKAEAGPGNAVCMAKTPYMDGLLEDYPHMELGCAGRDVGLPEGFMGNSEVGHTNIGAGRVVYQDMTRIDMALDDGSFFENDVLNQVIDAAKESGGRLHLMGLVSDGGVHSHIRHLYGLLELAKRREIEVFVHVFLDGRDTAPTSGLGYVQDLLDKVSELGVGRIASISGRHYAMDRDKRWERTELAYDTMVRGAGRSTSAPLDAIKTAYDTGKGDEFVMPTVVMDEGKPVATIDDGDGLVFFNFRADRARQITETLSAKDFDGFDRTNPPKLAGFATMTEYDSAFGLPVAFPPEKIEQTLGETVSRAGYTQLRLAETEKYAHVTYFLNCGREEPFEGEDHILVPSPREVDTYDEKPSMSADQVVEKFLDNWAGHDLTVCNLANPDMVAHTGSLTAAVDACVVVDDAVKRMVEAVLDGGGRVLITADHGNAEEMLDESGDTQTKHSTNPVPFIYVERGREDARLAETGRLADIAPTVLALMGIPKPEAMTGQPLLED